MTRRIECQQCARPPAHCVCALIPSLANRTRVLILQHPNEAKHPFNTARFAALGLRNAELITGEQFDAGFWQRSDMASWLLFPGPDAITADALGGTNTATNAINPTNSTNSTNPIAATTAITKTAVATTSLPIQLVVPDGTWRKVRGLLTANPTLAKLPRIAIPAAPASAYRIRHARRPDALATIEAIAHVLSLIEPTMDFAPLLAPFEAMVVRQLQAASDGRVRLESSIRT